MMGAALSACTTTTSSMIDLITPSGCSASLSESSAVTSDRSASTGSQLSAISVYSALENRTEEDVGLQAALLCVPRASISPPGTAGSTIFGGGRADAGTSFFVRGASALKVASVDAARGHAGGQHVSWLKLTQQASGGCRSLTCCRRRRLHRQPYPALCRPLAAPEPTHPCGHRRRRRWVRHHVA